MQDLTDTLDEMGFYRYGDAADILALKWEFQEGGCLFGQRTGRLYLFDAEFLAEGGVKDYLETLAPVLERQGIVVRTIQQRIDFDRLDYRIRIENSEYIIYEPSETATKDTWALAIIRTFLLVNHLLERAASEEKFFLVARRGPESRLLDRHAGDMAGVFISLAQYELISNLPILMQGTEFTWFGNSEFKLNRTGQP